MSAGLDLYKLKVAAGCLKKHPGSYRNAYPEFIRYFSDLPIIRRQDLIIAAHFTYGWMPTILTLDLIEEELVINLLNKVRGPELLKVEDISVLKSCINNSLVGASKLLHFINPEVYPIWDSNIYRFYTGKNTSYGIGFPGTYLSFLNELHQVAGSAEVTELHAQVIDILGYPVSRIRALELIMFEAARSS